MRIIVVALLSLVAFSLHAAPKERIVIGAENRRGISIVDPADENRVLWHYPTGPVHDLQLLPNYHLLTQDGWTNLIELDLSGNCVWNYYALEQNREGASNDIEIHAFQKLPNGNLFFAESGASRILEITPEGNLIKQFPLSVSQSSRHSDTRRVRKLENGNFLVAHEADQCVKEYGPNGNVLWKYSIPLFGKKQKKGHGPEGFGGRCFAAIQAKNGNYLITTGNGHSILEVTPKQEIVWKLEQNDLSGITLAWVTTIEELENGNLRFGNCHAGPDNPQIIEVTRDKEVAWTFHDFLNFGNSLAVSLVIDGERAHELRRRLAKP